MNHETPNILLHPGGGGAQYPLRFKPFRPRELWRRTPGPRPPRPPSNVWRIIFGLLVILLIAAVILIALAAGWIGLSDPRSSDVLSIEQAETAGFVVERNVIDGRVRVLNGQFNGINASILIPEDGQTITTGIPEAQRVAQWQQLGGNWRRSGQARPWYCASLCRSVGNW